MKSLLLSLVLFLSASIEHTSSIAPVGYGHSPVIYNHNFDAVLPVIERKIHATDTKPNNDPPTNLEKELLNACLSGLVALTPHFIMGYY